MAKYSRGRYRKERRWFRNIGDPTAVKGFTNPNDLKLGEVAPKITKLK